MPERHPNVVNVDEAPDESRWMGDHWGASFKRLTPAMETGHLRINRMCVPPGRTATPFHGHRLEDEIFFVLEGQGVLRYGDALMRIRPGDTISCPRATGLAHQIANTGLVDLVYLAIGPHEPEEVCHYPDSGKVMVRGLGQIGRLRDTAYMDGEPDPPKIFEVIAESAL